MRPSSFTSSTPVLDFTLLDAWWRAANYLSVGQIYLMANALLREPLLLAHIKPRLLGHWGTTPGLNFIYAHMNRAIKAHDLDAIFIAGPGHGGPGVVANVYLEGTYSEVYPAISRDAQGMQRLFTQFSFPGGIPSHVAPETPGSIHEGGELGYRPEELFDAAGALRPEIAALAPEGTRRMSANPHANGGLLLKDLALPDFRDYAVAVPAPGAVRAEATRVTGQFLRDVMRLNEAHGNFRIVGPDETASNRLGAVFDVTDRTSTAIVEPGDDHVSPAGRVMEVLSEHLCQGWLEGYLLTGRHGFFSCYEAFIHIVDSMFNQHAKWLKTARGIAWRRPIASMNYLLTSHVWQQDHNGFSHQDPGFIDHVVNKSAEVVRVYLPPDANTLLSVVDHCLRSRDYVNVIVAGKAPAAQWLDIAAAERHCSAGLGVWNWASNDEGVAPDVVMACAGDVPTLETLAAVDLLRREVPGLKVRVVNVVDLMALQSPEAHPHGVSDATFDSIFTTGAPVIFAFHGYPALIHRLTYQRTNHDNFHVHGYREEGTTTTPFDMTVLNHLDRFHLAAAAIDRVPRIRESAGHVQQRLRDRLLEHAAYIRQHGEDMPEISGWQWPAQ